MQKTEAIMTPWLVECWEEPSGALSQDNSLWRTHKGVLRVAAIDGVTPTRACKPVWGLDGAAYAAAVARTVLSSSLDVAQALDVANEALYDPQLDNIRDGCQAAVSVADIQPDGEVLLWRAADCEAWVRYPEGRFQPIFLQPTLAPAVIDAVAALYREMDGEGFTEEASARESELIDDRSAWLCPALGRYPDLVTQQARLPGGWEELILASDGALLNAAACAGLEEWLHGLRDYERSGASGPRFKTSDDVTVVRVRSLS